MLSSKKGKFGKRKKAVHAHSGQNHGRKADDIRSPCALKHCSLVSFPPLPGDNLPLLLLVQHQVDAVDSPPDGEAEREIELPTFVLARQNIDNVAAHLLGLEHLTKLAWHIVHDRIMVADEESKILEMHLEYGPLLDVRTNRENGVRDDSPLAFERIVSSSVLTAQALDTAVDEAERDGVHVRVVATPRATTGDDGTSGGGSEVDRSQGLVLFVSDEQVAQRERIFEVEEVLACLNLVVGRRDVGEWVFLVWQATGTP